MMCDHCKHASAVGGFPDGMDMFVCDCEQDPRIPFDMDEGVICPLFEEEEE